ncbi:tyrosine-type recombinase/integrase [Streptomyces sp. MS19]|uniref:tyrosine-type recombinase/integrase n=1 Tax=Streptomyces sp. MS19 TaxID=3385972 RepID=UPI0039A22938
MRRKKGKHPKAVLFPPPGTRGATLMRNAWFDTARWKEVKELAAERGPTKDPKPHSQCHSHASHLLSRHTMEAVSKRLGHGSGAITSAIYSHLTTEADGAMAKTADEILRRRLRLVSGA